LKLFPSPPFAERQFSNTTQCSRMGWTSLNPICWLGSGDATAHGVTSHCPIQKSNCFASGIARQG